MISTTYLIKLYILINLLFLMLLISNDISLFIVIFNFITIYFGCNTIYCLLEGNCYIEVMWVFILYIISHIMGFLYLKGFFPETLKYIDGISQTIKRDYKRI